MRLSDKRFFTNPGSPIHQLYAPKVMKDGSLDLVPAGVENTDDFIQSFEESTDMSILLAQLAQGDTSVLYKRAGSFGDFTKMPSTFAETLQLQIDSNRLFDSLPVEVKQKFDSDPNKFFAASGTEEWFSKIEAVLPDEVKKTIMPSHVETVSEVKADE